MIGRFEFEHGGRTYVCTPESRDVPVGTWWWFSVSHDQHRYAPFEASSRDTRDSVRTRIVEYYERLVWARAQPPAQRQPFGRGGKPDPNAKPGANGKPAVAAGKPGAPAAAAVPAAKSAAKAKSA